MLTDPDSRDLCWGPADRKVSLASALKTDVGQFWQGLKRRKFVLTHFPESQEIDLLFQKEIKNSLRRGEHVV